MKTLTATVVTVTMAMTASQTMAAAAAAPAAAAAQVPVAVTINHGPPITGVCVLSAAGVQGTSLYGKAIDKQLDAIGTQTNNELTALKNSIGTEATTLDKNKATMTELQYNTQMLTLQDKANSFQALLQQRQQEMDLTEQGQNQVFSQELQKIAIQVYQEQKCSILLDRELVMITAPSMDVTEAVIKAMDKDKTTVAPFTRSSVPAAPAATAVTR